MSGQRQQTVEGTSMPLLRRLDHVAVAVVDTEQALRYFRGTLGLEVVHVDELDDPPVTLTYLDAGNLYIQLVSPRAPCEIERWLEERGEGLHHLCFAVDDVPQTVLALSEGERPPDLGSGRGRVAAFIRNGSPCGVLLECTEFRGDDGPALGQSSLVPE
jgi:methylmalonyl-CoA/ethylmalonyl-CoA epimerase